MTESGSLHDAEKALEATRAKRHAVYPAYKPSDVDWLDDLPSTWGVMRLKYIASINDEALPETTDPNYEFHYVDIGNVSATHGILAKEPQVFEDAPSRARRVVRKGDTIVSTVRTYLRAIAPIRDAEDNLIVSTGFAVVRPRDIDPDYLSFTLRSPYFVETVVSRSTGVSYPAINASEIGRIALPLPPQDEQQAIALFLDEQTAKIDALIEAKRELLVLLKEKRQAVITHAVTKGLDPEAILRPSRVEWLGEVPEHWEDSRIKYLSSGRAHSFIDGDWIELPFITDSGVRLIQCGNIGTGVYEEQGYRYISEETFAEFGCTEVTPNDVLICRLRSSPRILAGRACVAPPLGHRMITSVDNCILKVDSSIDPRFVVYQLSTPAYLQYIEVVARGGTRDRISRSMLGMIGVVVPPEEEQSRIADYLDKEMALMDTISAETSIALKRLTEYRTALISAAVTGKIDVRGGAA